MAVRVTHAKVSGKAAGTDPNRVYGTHWDADHTIADLTIPGSLTVEGEYDLTLELTGDTDVTLPTTGTLATTADLSSGYQPLDSDLTAIAALTTTSYGRAFLALDDAAAARTATGSVIGTDVQAYDSDLAALAANTSNGLWARTSAGNGSARTITGTTNQITVTNGDGVSGNPTIALATNPGFSASKGGTNQTGIADITFTDVTWSTEIHDRGSYFASDAWVPPSGLVVMSVKVLVSGTWAVGAQLGLRIRKNGSSTVGASADFFATAANVNAGQVTVSDVANGTDSYTVQVYIDVSSGTGTVIGNPANTNFFGVWLGP